MRVAAMQPVVAAMALICVGAGGRAQSGGTPATRFLTLYYIPFHLTPFVGVTEKTIRGDAHFRFRVELEEPIVRVFEAVATETPGGPSCDLM